MQKNTSTNTPLDCRLTLLSLTDPQSDLDSRQIPHLDSRENAVMRSTNGVSAPSTYQNG